MERKRFGESARSRALRALPSPARCLSPALRAETSVVSDMEKRPLRRIKMMTIVLCNARR